MICKYATRCAFLAALLAAGSLSALPGSTSVRQTEATPAPPAPTPQEIVTASGLRYRDLQVGEGAEATKGKTVEVLYTGWLEDRTRFDSSLDPAHPFTFRIG